MIAGIFIQGKKYGFLHFIAATLMTVGLIGFVLADVNISPKFEPNGIVFITLSIISDAFIGNVQEFAMRTYKINSVEIIYYSYSLGALAIFTYLVLINQFLAPFIFCWEQPTIYWALLCYSILGYVGLQFLMALVNLSGAFHTVVVTTCRKAITIILSFIFFEKPFVIQYVWSGMIVVLGIFANFYAREQQKRSKNSISQSRINDLDSSHSINSSKGLFLNYVYPQIEVFYKKISLLFVIDNSNSAGYIKLLAILNIIVILAIIYYYNILLNL